jgi:hypothetical protein
VHGPSVSHSKALALGATSVDATAVLNEKLALQPDHRLEDTCVDVAVRECIHHGPPTAQIAGGLQAEDCHTIYKKQCSPHSGKLTVGSLSTVSSNVSIGEVDWKNVPKDVFAAEQEYLNCTAVTQTQTLHHLETVTKGNTVQKTKTVDNTISLTVSVTGKVDVGIWGGSTTTSLNFSNKVSVSESTTESFTQAKTESVDLPITVPSLSFVNAKHYFIQYTVPVPFSGTVVVDGPINANRDAIARVSQVLPREEDRTFEFQGTLLNRDIIDQKSDVQQRKPTGSECSGEQQGKMIVRTISVRPL